MTEQLPPEQRNAIALALVANKAAIGLQDMSDQEVMEQAHTLYAALLMVCTKTLADVEAGKPGAVERARALRWFTDVCLTEVKPTTTN